jgi:hypothetical protein
MSQAARTLKTLLRASAVIRTVRAMGTAGAIGAVIGAMGAMAAGRAAYAADHPNLQPGKWETSLTMDMPGMPARPAITTTHCVKPDEVKDNQSVAERMQANSKGKCKVSDVKFEGDKLSYSFTCDTGASGTTELVFGGTTYEGTTKISISGRGNAPAMSMTQHFKSKRLGDC